MTPPVPAPSSPAAVPSRPRRARHLAALLGILVLVGAGCTQPSNAPDDWGPRAEANVMEGCLASFDEEYGELVTLDDQDTTETDDDVVVVADGAPQDEVDYCGCLYDSYVDQLSFSEFRDLEERLEDDLQTAEDADEEMSPDAVPDELTEIADACAPPA